MGCSHSKTTENVETPAPPLSTVNEEVASASAPASSNPQVIADQVAESETSNAAPEVEQVPQVLPVPEVLEKSAKAEVEPEKQSLEQETHEKPESASALVFVAGTVAFNEKGVAFYNYNATSPTDPNKEVHVSKRFSEFKALHAEMAKLMASEKNVSASDKSKFETYPALPALPKAGVVTFLHGRSDPKMVQERETQFLRILNAVARHPIACQSTVFTEFLA